MLILQSMSLLPCLMFPADPPKWPVMDSCIAIIYIFLFLYIYHFFACCVFFVPFCVASLCMQSCIVNMTVLLRTTLEINIGSFSNYKLYSYDKQYEKKGNLLYTVFFKYG